MVMVEKEDVVGKDRWIVMSKNTLCATLLPLVLDLTGIRTVYIGDVLCSGFFSFLVL